MSAKRLRILLLFEVHETPRSEEEYERLMTSDEDWFTEGNILDALREYDHEVHLGAIHEHPREVIDLVDAVKPDLVWNCVETFHGHRYYEANVVGILELMRVPYTGCGSRGMMLCQDKALSKRILTHHRINVPKFVVSRASRPLRSIRRFEPPVFVKPLSEEGSVGIAKDSFADTEEQALKRAAFLHESLGQDAIIEEYIEGRELYVGLLGERRLQALPPREIRFQKMPEDGPRFASYKAKWDYEYRKRWGIDNVFPEDLSERSLREMNRVAKRTFRALQMRCYGRIDMRVTPQGKVYVMEANPNPAISIDEDYPEAARRAGIEYDDLIERITRMGMRTRFP